MRSGGQDETVLRWEFIVLALATAAGCVGQTENPGTSRLGRVALMGQQSSPMSVPIESKQQLFDAVYTRDVQRVRALLPAFGPIVDGSEAVPALQAAVERGYDEVVFSFLDAGATVDVRDGAQSTALMWAAGAGNVRLTRELLQRGADPNLADNVGWTALFHAAAAQQLEVVKLLLEAGADVAVRDLTGQTAVDLARYRRFRDGRGQYPTLFDTPVRAVLKKHVGRSTARD